MEFILSKYVFSLIKETEIFLSSDKKNDISEQSQIQILATCMSCIMALNSVASPKKVLYHKNFGHLKFQTLKNFGWIYFRTLFLCNWVSVAAYERCPLVGGLKCLVEKLPGQHLGVHFWEVSAYGRFPLE